MPESAPAARVRAPGAPDSPLADQLGRGLRALRVSVTDRCNMRCAYCMPEAEYVWLPRESILSFAEIARLARLFVAAGVDAVRLTGGEPLLRRELGELVGMLAATSGIRDLALTTNGLLLAAHASRLAAAGLARVTVSLDTLQPARFAAAARGAHHADVLAGIRAAQDAGLGVKVNAVVIRGFNDDELGALLEWGRARAIEVRFIEYMDVGGATRWSQAQVVGQSEILATLGARFGKPVALPRGGAPATQFQLPDGTRFGIVASVTAPFCRSCERSRLAADGLWFRCLYEGTGLDLRTPLRRGAGDAELGSLIAEAWQARAARGAEERAALRERGVLYRVARLRADPHREMHTRGG